MNSIRKAQLDYLDLKVQHWDGIQNTTDDRQLMQYARNMKYDAINEYSKWSGEKYPTQLIRD